MKVPVLLYLALTFWLVHTGSLSAQKNTVFDPLTEDISKKLPPLEILIDSAIVNSPQLIYSDQQLMINESKLRSKRIEWTRNVGLQANVGYGNLFNYATSSTGSIDPIPVASSSSQTQYTTAFYINLPFSTIADRRNQLRLARSEIIQAESLILSLKSEIRQIVITQYNNLILKQRLLSIKAKNLETVKMSMEMREKEFLNGVIPLTEYTNISSSLSDLETGFENARMEFLTAYMILEEIVGIRFNLINTIPENYEHN
ncbi:MAG: TolC family protein [Bacteroidales bacterium]|nr:TolC family protein [Bacteroidales bacterium]MBK9358996.1 TolC family protein [Bacteroidales bacterium]